IIKNRILKRKALWQNKTPLRKNKTNKLKKVFFVFGRNVSANGYNKIKGCRGKIILKKEKETITNEWNKTPSKPNLER
ncbi:TPA: hypothetical protein ACIKBF_004519, partial [Salmonella enterica]